MLTAERLDVFTPFLKKERDADGVLWVEGKFTGPDLDSDGQRMDPVWLKSAVPDYMRGPAGGNVREAHDARRPIGKAVEAWETDDNSWHMRAKIVDDAAIRKIEHGVLAGFSIGVVNPRIVKSVDAPHGKCAGGSMIEVSCVDRGSLPTARFSIAKADGAGALQVVEHPELVEGDDAAKAADYATTPRPQMLLKTEDGRTLPMTAELVDQLAAPSVVANLDDPDADPQAIEKAKGKPFGGNKAKPFGSDDSEDEDESDEEGDGDGEKKPAAKKGAEKAAGGNGAGDAVAPDMDALAKAVAAILEKKQFTQAERDKAEDKGHAMSGGGFPIENVAQLKDAVQAIGRAKDRAATIKHIVARAKALNATSELPEGWAQGKTDSQEKAASADLAKDMGPTSDDEEDDIACAKAVIAGIARLIQSEALGLAAGQLNEIGDIRCLADAACMLTIFIESEAGEVSDKTPAAGTDTSPADTTPTPAAVIQLADQPDVTKAAQAATPDLAAQLNERLEKRLTEARAALAAATETAPGVTKADTPAEAPSAPPVLTADDLTKAMEPLLERLAQVQAEGEEVKALLKSTPRPGGPAVTAVKAAKPDPVALAKAAQVASRRKAFEDMLASSPAPALRAEIERQIEALA